MSSTVPTITPSTTSLGNFTTAINTPSASQNLTVTGTSLTANITATAPEGFEVSYDNSPFDTTATIPQTSGSANGTLSIRLASLPTPGNPSGNLTLSSEGAANATVALSGVVIAPPEFLTNSFTATVGVAFNQTLNATNAPTNYSASGSLPAGLTLNSTTGAITGTPTTAGDFTLNATVTNSAGSANGTLSFSIAKGDPTITTAPTATPIREGQPLSLSTLSGGAASVNGTFAFTNPSATPATTGNQSVSFTPVDLENWNTATTNVSVTVNPAPTINATPATLSGFIATTIAPSSNQTVTVNGTNLEGAITATAPAGYEISRDGVAYSSNLTLSPGPSAAPVAQAATIIASDNASNYGGGWTTGSNGGSGFGNWTISSIAGTGFSGTFLGDPTAAEITGMPNPSFGMYANPAGSNSSVTAFRTFSSPLEVGQSFSFKWATNYDSGGGNKGFNIFAGDIEVINVNQGGFPGNITISGNNTGIAYGTGPMTWTITRTSQTNLLVTSTARDGSALPVFSTNVTISSSPSRFSWYVFAMDPGDQRQPYFNNLQITSAGSTGGNLTNTTLYVRLAGNGTVGAKTGNLTFTSTNATTKAVALSGAVNLPPPVLAVSAASLPAFTTSLNTPSSPASFTVNGTYLTTNVSVSAPAGFEVSTNNATGFGADVTLVPQSGTLASTTLFARLAAQGNATLAPLTGNITLASGNASASVGVTGEVFEIPAGPFIRLGNSTASIPLAIVGEPSAPTGPLVLDGFALTGNLVATTQAGLEISTAAGGPFSSNLGLAPDNQGRVQSIQLFIRTSATAPVGAFSSNVTLSSAGAESKTIAVSGTIAPKPLLGTSTASLPGFATRTGEGPSSSAAFTVNATNLLGNVTLTAPGGFEIATSAQGPFALSLNLPAGNGTLTSAILVRLAASQTKSNPSGNLTISSPQADSRQVALTGIVRGPATLSVTPASLSSLDAVVGNASANQTLSVAGVDLHGPIDLLAPAGFEISLDGTNFTNSLRISSNATSGEPALLAVDSAANYNGNWGNGTNEGWGFSPWEMELTPGTGFAGAFIGDPSSAGITNMSATSFGLFANPNGSGAKAEVSRGMPPLAVGDSFSFQWATNWDSGAGNKGFSLFVGETQIANVNQGNFPGDITLNGQLAIDGDSGYGSAPMIWTFTRTTATNLLVTSTARNGNPGIAYSANLTIGGAPDGFLWYVDAMEAGDQRQPYFNSLRLVSGSLFGGDIPATTVYVRLASSNAESSFTGNLNILSPLAETLLVPLSGRAIPPSTLSASPAQIGGLATKIDDPADPYKATGFFVVNGKGLVGNVTVSPSPGLELSGNNSSSTFGSAPITITPENGDVQQIVYARISATAESAGLFRGNATLSSFGAPDVVVSVAGSVLDDSVVFRNPGLAASLGTQNDLNFDWVTNGNGTWFSQSDETFDGVDALQSGAIGNEGRSTVLSELAGPGRLTFHWKVSSSAANGRLVLFVNGLPVESIAGEVGWEQKSILLPSREKPHTIRFDYTKGSGATGGLDAAWLDQVSFVPGEFSPQIAIEYGGAKLAMPGGVVPFRIQGLERSQTRAVTIRNTGTAPLVLAGNPTVFGPAFTLSSNASRLTLDAGESVDVGVSSTSTVGNYPTWSGALVVNSNDPVSPSISIPLQGLATLTPLENWRGQRFLTPENTGNASNSADPDNDGLPNILEYAFGFEPWIANPAPPVAFGDQPREAKRHLTLLFDRRRDDLEYIVEASANLQTWNPVKTYIGTAPDGDAPYFVDTGYDLNAPTASRRFLRVKVQER